MQRPRLTCLVLPPLGLTAHTPDPFGVALTEGGALFDRRPDLVFVNGLAADASLEAYRTARTALERLVARSDRQGARLFLAPGRGDRLDTDVSPLVAAAGAGMPPAVLFHPTQREMLLRPFAGFVAAQASFASAECLRPERPFAYRVALPRELQVAVIGLNSAWFETDRPVVGASAFAAELIRQVTEGRPDVVVVHVAHPPEVWHPEEREALAPLLRRADLLIHCGAPVASADDAGVPRVGADRGAWVELFDDHFVAQPLDPRWAPTGDAARIPLARRLPSRTTASVAVGGEPIPDLESYLRYVRDEHGQVILTGIVDHRRFGDHQDQLARVPVGNIYVSLRTAAPRRDRSPAGQVKLPDAKVWGGDDEAKAHRALAAALKQLGLPHDERAARHARSRLRAMQASAGGLDVAAALELWELEQAVAAHESLLLEGAPGCGKTTTLQAVAAALVDAHLGRPARAEAMGLRPPWKIPVVVPFRQYWRWLAAQPEDRTPDWQRLVEYLRRELGGHSGGEAWVEPALREGRVALLLDGVDELPDGLPRERALRAVRDCHHRFAACRWMVTSRPSGLDERARQDLGAFTHFQVRPLDPDQVEAFLRIWFERIASAAEAADRAADLVRQLAARDELTDPRSPARTPITLVAIAIVGADGRLPALRATLYDECVETLCHRWDWRKTEAYEYLRGPLDLSAKRTLLQRLARQAFEAGTEVIEAGTLLEHMWKALPPDQRPPDIHSCRQFVDQLAERSGLLVPEGGHWRFRHRTFLEFLTARAICVEETDPTPRLKQRLHVPAWREVILLALGFQAQVYQARTLETLASLASLGKDKDIAKLIEPADQVEAWSVLARAAVDLRAYGLPGLDAQVEPWKSAWVALIDDRTTPGRLEARVALGEALGWFGDPRIGWTEAHFPLVPAGAYVAGAVDEKAWKYEEDLDPARFVETYRVGRYAVTVSQFLEFADAPDFMHHDWWVDGGAEDDERARWFAWLRRQNPSHPATMITWYEARAFCRWATVHHPVCPGWSYDLPDDAQWEKSARGGAVLPDGTENPYPRRLYPWGDDPPTPAHANFFGTGLDRVAPVGLFPAGAGASGAVDLAGNVLEWSRSTLRAPARVCRGGAFDLVPQWLRVSSRGDFGHPYERYGFFGFRCVAVPPQDP